MNPTNTERALRALDEAYRLANDGEQRYLDGISGVEADFGKRQMDRGWSLLLQGLAFADLNVLYEICHEEWRETRAAGIDVRHDDDSGEHFVVGAAMLRTRVWDAQKLLRDSATDVKGPALNQLIDILRQCERYVSSDIFSWRPTREQDIDERIEAVLKCVYARINSNPSVPNVIKNYSPDTEIEDLSAVLDYKFVQSRDQAKRTVDELSADLLNYKDERVKHIIFVVYETVRTYTEHEWQRHFTDRVPGLQVTVILLKGVEFTEEDKLKSSASAEVKRI